MAATVERSFSKLKILKKKFNHYKSQMSQDCLVDQAMISIENKFSIYFNLGDIIWILRLKKQVDNF